MTITGRRRRKGRAWVCLNIGKLSPNPTYCVQMERERCEILSAYTEHPDMECMWSQREPCGHTCSHVGIKIALALLSFAVCLLFAWNICLQLQLYANMDMSTRCSDIHVHEPLKGEMKTSKTKNSEVYILSCFQFCHWINDKIINCYLRRF